METIGTSSFEEGRFTPFTVGHVGRWASCSEEYGVLPGLLVRNYHNGDQFLNEILVRE